MMQDGPKAVRENLASQLLSLGNKVADQAAKIRERQANRLDVVTRPPSPTTKTEQESPAEEWPSLLSNLRALFWQIEMDLSKMEDTLNRLEI